MSRRTFQRSAAAAVVLLTFGALLAWRTGVGSDQPDVAAPADAPTSANHRNQKPAPTTSVVVTAGTGTAAAGPRLLPLPDSNSGSIPTVTELTTLGPGPHQVSLLATSDKPMLGVAYSVKAGHSRGEVFHVRAPLRIVRTVNGGRPYAAITVQLGPDATSGTCSIAIDGKIVDRHSTTRAYDVIGCVG